MQYSDLMCEYNEYVAVIKDLIDEKWETVRELCPAISHYDSYDAFAEEFELEDLDGDRQELYREIGQAFKCDDQIIEVFALLLFSKKLRDIISLTYCHYGYQVIIDDVCNMTVEEFLLYLKKECPMFPKTTEVFTHARNKITGFYKQYTDKHDGKLFKKWLALYQKKKGLIEKDTQFESAVYNELRDFIRSRLTPEEFAALCLRQRYEFWDRRKKISQPLAERNTADKRRAIKKSRRILCWYGKNGGL